MTQRFREAVAELINRYEGGYIDDPEDDGGQTKYGISKRSYPDEDIPKLSRERAEQIYWRDFWSPYEIDRMPGRIGEKFFQTVVNMPAAQAVTILQRALRAATSERLADDGILGPRTRAVMDGITARGIVEAVLAALRSEQAGYYRQIVQANPSQGRFLKGWLNRAYA